MLKKVGVGEESAAGNHPRRCGGQPVGTLPHQTPLRETSIASVPGGEPGVEGGVGRKPVSQGASVSHEKLERYPGAYLQC